ncbi:hypothetical protein ACLEIY_17405 [Acetobacter tropicalis]
MQLPAHHPRAEGFKPFDLGGAWLAGDVSLVRDAGIPASLLRCVSL